MQSGAVAASLLSGVGGAAPKEPPRPRLRRWRGFNLTELMGGKRGSSYVESDFQWMKEWGFDFARLPMSYWTWSSPKDWMTIDGRALHPVDQAIEWGRIYQIHVNLCLHRIPGYCVNGRELEPEQLFDGSNDSMQKALAACVRHWRCLTRRYLGVSHDRLSFDLFNEPPFMKDQSRYVEIVRTLVTAIREIDPNRMIVVDGADLGQTPVHAITDLDVVQSTRGYLPKMISHYTASWVPPNEFESTEVPTWPMRDRQGTLWDRAMLREKLIGPWQSLVARKSPIHVGEWGCFHQTSHAVALAWMRDLLSLWKEVDWGWAMWNLRGDFGIVDSERPDVSYEDFHGHKLDRQMLELLRAH